MCPRTLYWVLTIYDTLGILNNDTHTHTHAYLHKFLWLSRIKLTSISCVKYQMPILSLWQQQQQPKILWQRLYMWTHKHTRLMLTHRLVDRFSVCMWMWQYQTFGQFMRIFCAPQEIRFHTIFIQPMVYIYIYHIYLCLWTVPMGTYMV